MVIGIWSFSQTVVRPDSADALGPQLLEGTPAITNPTRDHTIDICGTAAAIGAVLCWGLIPVLLRELTTSIDAWTANGFRYPLSALLYWPILLVAHRTGGLDRHVIARCVVPALLALSGQVLWALAPYYLTASSIGFFVRMSLVWALVGAMSFFPDERRLLRLPTFYIGLLLSVGGFLVLSITKGMFDPDVTVAGVAIILFCSLFFGLYSVSVRHYLRGIHPVVGFGVVSQFVSIGTLTAMAAFGRPQDLLAMSTQSWCMLVASSILGIALGHFFLYTAVGRLGAAIASGTGALTPFVTAAISYVFLRETLTSVQWSAGIAMVIGAVVLLATQHAIAGPSRRRATTDDKSNASR